MVIGGYECITVAELIEHLKTMPQDAPCIYRCCSDYSALRKDEVIYTEDKFETRNGMIHGEYKPWVRGGEPPVYVKVVSFPGN